MKRSYLIIILVLFLITPVFALSLYSQDLITKDTFFYKEESKSEIKTSDLITINITPYLSTGKILDRTIQAKELPLNQVITVFVEYINDKVKKTKVVQMYPETIFEMSDDAEIVKQSSADGKVRLQIHYGYQTDKPWDKYYKVEGCNFEFCRVVRADFTTRVVTVSNVPLTEINKITGIVAYEALP